MNFEKIKNISSPIEVVDREEREDILLEKIGRISLVYSEEQLKKRRQAGEDYSFSEAIKEYSPLKNIILRPIFELYDFDHQKHEGEIEKFFEKFYREIDVIYEDKGLDLEAIGDLIKEKMGLIKSYLGAEGLRQRPQKKEGRETKVLQCNKISNAEKDEEGKYNDLKDLGFNSQDQFIEVHVDTFFKTDQEKLGIELIRKDLALVAEHIIDKEPMTAAVVGSSWLLDTSLSKHLGFIKIEGKDKDSQNDFSTWFQFIDKDGQIDRNRLKNFLESGQLPYKSVRAYMKTEDFLKRYLPAERRGKIHLQEVDEEKSALFEILKKEVGSAKEVWDNLIENKGDIADFIGNDGAVNHALNILDPDDKNRYISFFKEMRSKNIFWEDFSSYKDEQIRDIDKKIDLFIRTGLFKEKEVFIE